MRCAFVGKIKNSMLKVPQMDVHARARARTHTHTHTHTNTRTL
jgi:hypothetical protein